MSLSPDEIAALFSQPSGTYAFARWGRPIAPVVFGVDDATLTVIKQAAVAITTLAIHELTEIDQELASNLMLFFVSDWTELSDAPQLHGLVPDLADLVARLTLAEANQYRIFRFDSSGAIMACMVFLRMDEHLAAIPAETFALGQMVQVIVTWSETAFREVSPLMWDGNTTVLRPDICLVIRAAYDPVLPSSARDPSHALRLFARTQVIENA